MPHSHARCQHFSPPGQSLAIASPNHSSTYKARRLDFKQRCIAVSSTATTASPSTHATESVKVGTTPFGRGLLSCKDLPSGQRLVSVPFSQILLLPDKVDASFERTQHLFLCDHGVLPPSLLRFIQGVHLLIMHYVHCDIGCSHCDQSTAGLTQEAFLCTKCRRSSLGLAIDSLAALACKAWQQFLEAVCSELAPGKTYYLS